MKKISLILMVLLCNYTAKSQTIYGVTGLIKIPNAYTINTGKLNLGASIFKDYFEKNDNLYNQNAGFVNIGFHSRLEIGLRMSKLPDKYITEVDDIADSSGAKSITDRVLSVKFVIVKEKQNLPQISFGMQDIIGTRIHNSTYIVATKNLLINKLFNTILTLGYGNKANSVLFGEANSYHFLGVFGGCETGYKKVFFASIEYDGKDVNAGLRLTLKEKFNFNISLFKIQYLMSTISYTVKI